MTPDRSPRKRGGFSGRLPASLIPLPSFTGTSGAIRGPPMRTQYRDPLPVTIDEWSDDGVRLIKCHAKLASEVVGLAVFAAVVKENPTLRLTLRHGAMVFSEHLPEPWQSQPRRTNG